MINKIYTLIIIVLTGFLVYSCANRAQGPTGGPKDETPPRVLKSSPENGSLNFSKKQIFIDFDENISIEKPAENVIISPPQIKPPDVKSLGKRVSVNFNEELLDSTTYTVNFGDAIVDLNEKNALKNYVFSFSTGNEIDTLKISGVVIDAENLNPMQGVIVGIYLESSDSVFFQKPFLRIGRTDDKGMFTIDNVKKGTYKVFALGDSNRDYFFQPGESLAMHDSLVIPTFRVEEVQDTVWKDSVQVDSIRTIPKTKFLPNDLLLRHFKEDKKRQYFVKSERKQAQSFTLFFNTTLDDVPEIKPLNFNWDGKYLLQKNNTRDTLTYWLTDSAVWKVDTLEMAVSYHKTDSIFRLVPTTDTVSVFMRKPRVNTKSKTVAEVKKEFYKFTNNIAGTFDVYSPIILKFDAPLEHVDLTKIKLAQKVDTTLKKLTYKWRQTDSTAMNFAIEYKWEPEKSYELKIDSAAFRSIYQLYTDKYSGQFKIRSLDEYSAVKIFLAEFDSLAVFQILDSKDVVLSTKPASTKGTLFEYLKPGDYFMRLFIDANRNGKWDTGDLSTRTQPEEVFYYSKKMTLRANWEFEETWNHKELPLLEQKPTELKKDPNKK